MGPQGMATPDAMVAAADAAMYDAKRSGRGLCVLYDEDRHGPVRFAELEASGLRSGLDLGDHPTWRRPSHDVAPA